MKSMSSRVAMKPDVTWVAHEPMSGRVPHEAVARDVLRIRAGEQRSFRHERGATHLHDGVRVLHRPGDLLLLGVDVVREHRDRLTHLRDDRTRRLATESAGRRAAATGGGAGDGR